METKRDGKIPTLHIIANSIPEAYEQALKKVWENGIGIRTQYDKKNANGDFIDPPSADATVMIEVKNPFNQPRFSRIFSDSLGALGEYVQEVVSGAHDYWMIPNVEIMNAAKQEKLKEYMKGKTQWSYTYHQRLFDYPLESGGKLNQIDSMVERLCKDGFTRRAEAITWVPLIDSQLDDPPCLQRVWGRIVKDEKGDEYFNMNTDWRSRDLFKAWMENVIALTTLQRNIAREISERTGREIKVGRYCDKSDSLHIYGSYFKDFAGTMEKINNRTFEERTWDSDYVSPFFLDDGCGKGLEVMLDREKDMPSEVKQKIQRELDDIKAGRVVV